MHWNPYASICLLLQKFFSAANSPSNPSTSWQRSYMTVGNKILRTNISWQVRIQGGARRPGGPGPCLDLRFWGPKIENFWALFNFSIIFFASLCSAYYSLICCFFIVQIKQISSLISLGIWFLFVFSLSFTHFRLLGVHLNLSCL